MEPALHELSESLDKLSQSIDGMLVEQNAAEERRLVELRAGERQRNRRSWVILACVAILAVMAITNRTVLNKINAVTGPTAQDHQAVSTAALLAANQRESDCLSRRQQARLPAPAPAPAPPPGIRAKDLPRFLAPYSCVAQTPHDVYPGVAGEPARPSAP